MRGTPSPVLEGVAYSPATGAAQFDVSRSGTLIYRSGGGAGASFAVQWLDSAGKTQLVPVKPGVWERPRLSPDGQRLALGDGTDIWIYETRRDTMMHLTSGSPNSQPVWSPDGRYIVFSGPGGIWWIRSDGAGKPQRLIPTSARSLPSSFTQDGRRLAYYELASGSRSDIWTVAIESEGQGLRAGKPESFLQTQADERHGAFSPDGHWLAYTSDESGTFQLYVRAFPDSGGKWQISNAGGANPVWSRDGRELMFRGGDNRIMAVTYAAKADSFVPDKPRVWADKQVANLGTILTGVYDLAPDGKRIVTLMPVEAPAAQQAQNHVTFVLNFADELQRRVPLGK